MEEMKKDNFLRNFAVFNILLPGIFVKDCTKYLNFGFFLGVVGESGPHCVRLCH